VRKPPPWNKIEEKRGEKGKKRKAGEQSVPSAQSKIDTLVIGREGRKKEEGCYRQRLLKYEFR